MPSERFALMQLSRINTGNKYYMALRRSNTRVTDRGFTQLFWIVAESRPRHSRLSGVSRCAIARNDSLGHQRVQFSTQISLRIPLKYFIIVRKPGLGMEYSDIPFSLKYIIINPKASF